MFEDDEEDPINLDDAFADLGMIMRWIYFHHMTNATQPNFKDFKQIMMLTVGDVLDIFHNKYADHMEGHYKMRKEYESNDSQTS